jgi:hypothetical protein
MAVITDAGIGTGAVAGSHDAGTRLTDGVDDVSVTFGAGQLSAGTRLTDGVEGVSIDKQADGAIVPLGDFRRVEITLVDTAGEPLISAGELVVEGPLPVSRPVSVDDGEASATAYLLKTTYSDARVTAQSDPELIYECVDGLPIGPRDESAVLQFRPVSVGESGLHVTETRLG